MLHYVVPVAQPCHGTRIVGIVVIDERARERSVCMRYTVQCTQQCHSIHDVCRSGRSECVGGERRGGRREESSGIECMHRV